MRKINEEKYNFWFDHIRACELSGLTQRSYCETHQLHLSQFGYWRHKSLKSHRNDLKRFSRSLRARTHRKQEEWFNKINQDVLFRSFPIWLIPLSDMTGCLPLRKEIFDGFNGVSTDTRTLEAGQLFVALKGPDFDGNRFVAEARP